MDKIAMVKSAEVRGVLACMVDNDMLKVANEEDFEAVAEVVAENLGDEYTLEDVMDTTAQVIETADALENMTEEELAELEASVAEEGGDVVDEGAADEDGAAKEASEVDTEDILAQYGELVMAKEAGEITDTYFEKKAASIQGILQALKGGAGKAYQGAAAAGRGAASAGRAAGQGAASAGRAAGQGAAAAGRGAKATGSYLKGGFTADKLRQAKGAAPGERKALLLKGLLQSGAAAGAAGGAAAGGKALYDRVSK